MTLRADDEARTTVEIITEEENARQLKPFCYYGFCIHRFKINGSNQGMMNELQSAHSSSNPDCLS